MRSSCLSLWYVSKRKCGNCGQVGHMKTNRKCPRWVEFNALVGGVSTPGSAGTPGADEG